MTLIFAEKLPALENKEYISERAMSKTPPIHIPKKSLIVKAEIK